MDDGQLHWDSMRPRRRKAGRRPACLQRPALPSAVCAGVAGELPDGGLSRASVADHAVEGARAAGIDAFVVEQLHRRLQVAQRGAAAFGEARAAACRARTRRRSSRVMFSSISTKPLQRHFAGLRVDLAHRRHLHAQQLLARVPVTNCAEVCGRRAAGAAARLQRMRDEGAVEYRVDRAAQAGSALAPPETLGALDSARNCARARLLQSRMRPSRLHTTTPASARPSARRGGCALLDAAAGPAHPVRATPGAQLPGAGRRAG